MEYVEGSVSSTHLRILFEFNANPSTDESRYKRGTKRESTFKFSTSKSSTYKFFAKTTLIKSGVQSVVSVHNDVSNGVHVGLWYGIVVDGSGKVMMAI